ncbi:LysM peptidoglycan-binding domain-containing protein [Treponema pectinovorum]|uniref:LysM peptidoglycan-binding domain-containing protein n=1 Tax=Treponema pectinovorum TaxID=164 RepID=UPI003D8D046A
MESSFCKNLKKFILSFSVFFLGFFIYPSPVHTVEKGDTLYSISKKYEISVKELANANKIEGTDIKIGQKLVIPVLQDKNEKDSASNPTNLSYYTVKKGDSWYAISRLYSVSVNELYKLNNSNESESLKIGQKIIVPLKENKNTVVTSQPEVKTPNSQVITPPLIKPENNLQQNRKGDSDLVWPVEKPEVTYISGKVSGVILSSKKDEVVKSIKSGTVMFSGSYRGFGNVVFIQSKTGHIYAYTGLGKVLVSKGEYIDFKAEIGRAGVDSYTSKNQISLMVFQNGLPIDPAKAPRG